MVHTLSLLLRALDVTLRKMSNVLVMSSFVNKLAKKSLDSSVAHPRLGRNVGWTKQVSFSFTKHGIFVTNLANGDFILKDLPL
jgi:hypothetical protein